MQLDVSTTAVAVIQLERSTGLVLRRIDDDAVAQPETNIELVFRAWFAVVVGAHHEVHIAVEIRSRRAAYEAGAGRLLGLRIGAGITEAIALSEIGGDRQPVRVEIVAVIVVAANPILGFRDIFVLNPNGQTARLRSGLLINR